MAPRKWKTQHTNFINDKFKAHKEDQDSGWDWTAIKPQIEAYYEKLMEEDADTPFHREPHIGKEKFCGHFKGKAHTYRIQM